MRAPALVLAACLLLLAAPPPAAAPTPTPLSLPLSLSPERQGLRAGSALSGLPPALLERPDRLHDPEPHDLNATLLRARLGRHFDPRVMSVQPPETERSSSSSSQRKAHKHKYDVLDPEEASILEDDDADFPFRRGGRGRLMPEGDMPESIASLDFRGVRLQDGTWLRTRISSRLRRKLQNYLWAYTACPVTRRWRDLGLRFWPRWLKEGHCPEAPCSIPPGMRCRPAATRHQSLLRWHCRSRPRPRARARPRAPPASAPAPAPAPHCSWIKVEYPVITRCSCACPLDDRYS